MKEKNPEGISCIGSVAGRQACDLTLMARTLCRVEVRRNRVEEVAKSIENGLYRVPARVLAACLMLEMLR